MTALRASPRASIPASIRASLRTTLLGLAAVASACALHHRTSASPQALRTLWTEPKDLEQRNLYDGPGGRDMAPRQNARYKTVGKKLTGTQPGFDLEEVGTGRHWSVKLGIESRTEVTVSRLVWAVGFHQPYVYVVPEWTMVKDGKDVVMKGPARFRLGAPIYHKRKEWSWTSNPFVGSRELAGLFTVMVMVNNWDLKRDQNALYDVVSSEGDTTQQFVVRDLGASLGQSKWLSFGSKDDPDAFDHEPFIRDVARNRVQFGYQGSWLVPQLLGSVAPSDVKWVCGLMSRLSDAQWRDAFRAGGFSDAEAERYIQRLKQKVGEGLAIKQ